MKRRTLSNSISKSDKQKFIKEFLTAISGEGLPEHDSPFKLYFNGKLISSANPPNQASSTIQDTDKGNDEN